ncbi:MAG TPA: phosphatidate cytidylyltransferase [Mucilaginibacter sp.]|jgi:phosphatidate cytidylyltransferase|nr:phosphatidate cytidylyltransferase [Mucilaginibacter sp.]
MKTRAITGFFFVVVMLASLLLGHYVFGAFFLVLSVLCLREFYSLLNKSGESPDMVTGLINGIFIYVIFALIVYQNNPYYHKLLFLLTLTVSAIFIQELFKRSSAPFVNIGYTLVGLIYICLPFTLFHAMAYVNGPFNFHYPLAFMLLLWANDTGAYLVGSKFGRTKLFERHSPKKTWEGFMGGIVISAIAAFIISYFFKELLWNQWVSVAILIAGFGTLGDLIESMFKRSIDVKDSGGILPGHGGLLDRFDGLLLAAPIVYTYLYFVTNS